MRRRRWQVRLPLRIQRISTTLRCRSGSSPSGGLWRSLWRPSGSSCSGRSSGTLRRCRSSGLHQRLRTSRPHGPSRSTPVRRHVAKPPSWLHLQQQWLLLSHMIWHFVYSLSNHRIALALFIDPYQIYHSARFAKIKFIKNIPFDFQTKFALEPVAIRTLALSSSILLNILYYLEK